MPTRRLLALAVALVVVLGACGDDDGGAATTTSSTLDGATTTTEAGDATTTSSGETTTTTAEPTTTSAEPTTTTEAEAAIQLDGNGLGLVAFGEDPNDTVDAVAAVLGPADEDSGWTGSFSVFGTCPGTQVRGVRWGRLQLLFTDGDTQWASGGRRHLFSFRYGTFVSASRSPDLATSRGLQVGDPASKALALYGDAATYQEGDEIFPALVEISEPGKGPMFAYLDDTDTVSELTVPDCGE